MPTGAVDGYMSDGDAFNHKSLSPSSHYQPHSPPSQSSIDDGYLSEGGASFYAKKIQHRIAIEKQKTVEEQNRKLEEFSSKRPLPGLPDVLGSTSNTTDMTQNQIYRVVGGRNKPKSEAGMQTESNIIKQSVQEHYDWKQVCVTVEHRFFLSKCQIIILFHYWKPLSYCSFANFFLLFFRRWLTMPKF